MMQTNIYSYTVRGTTIVNNVTNITVINNSSTYNQHTYYSGPHANDIEHVTGTRVNVVSVHETSTPITASNGEQLNIYRPVINNSSTVKVTPSKVVAIENIKPVVKQVPANNNTNINRNPQTPAKQVEQKQQPNIQMHQESLHIQPTQPPVKQRDNFEQKENNQQNPPVKNRDQIEHKQPPVTPERQNVQPYNQPPVRQRDQFEQKQAPVERQQPQNNSFEERRNEPVKQPEPYRQNAQPERQINNNPPQMNRQNIQPQQQQRSVPRSQPRPQAQPQQRSGVEKKR
jgi:hypothetical protein